MGHQLFLMPLFLRTAYAGRTQYLLIIIIIKKLYLLFVLRCITIINTLIRRDRRLTHKSVNRKKKWRPRPYILRKKRQ